HLLRKRHHLLSGIGREFLQLVQVRVGHNHDMPIRVWIGIENDVAMLGAVNDAGLLVAFFGSIAEDAARLLVGASNIGVTPRSPEIIHGARVAEIRCHQRATSEEPTGAAVRSKLAARKLAAHRQCDKTVNSWALAGIVFDTVPKQLL